MAGAAPAATAKQTREAAERKAAAGREERAAKSAATTAGAKVAAKAAVMAASTTTSVSTAREGARLSTPPDDVHTLRALCRLTTDRGRVVQIQKHGKGNYQVQAARGGCWEAA